MVIEVFNNEWDIILSKEMEKPYFKVLMQFVDHEYQTKMIYPYYSDLFNALKYTSYSAVNVVILGQDPYHGEGQAHGLAFSVKSGVTIPPSLQNIFKELHADLNKPIPSDGNLIRWANDGVLLLNTVLTVQKDHPASHKDKGWEQFTDYIIEKLNERDEPVVFILWGSMARSKKKLITNGKHLIIESSHPSPFSCNHGFFGSHPFSKTNTFLIKNQKKPINW